MYIDLWNAEIIGVQDDPTTLFHEKQQKNSEPGDVPKRPIEHPRDHRPHLSRAGHKQRKHGNKLPHASNSRRLHPQGG